MTRYHPSIIRSDTGPRRHRPGQFIAPQAPRKTRSEPAHGKRSHDYDLTTGGRTEIGVNEKIREQLEASATSSHDAEQEDEGISEPETNSAILAVEINRTTPGAVEKTNMTSTEQHATLDDESTDSKGRKLHDESTRQECVSSSSSNSTTSSDQDPNGSTSTATSLPSPMTGSSANSWLKLIDTPVKTSSETQIIPGFHMKGDNDERQYTRGPAKMVTVFDGERHCPAILLSHELSQKMMEAICRGREYRDLATTYQPRLDRLSHAIDRGNAKMEEIAAYLDRAERSGKVPASKQSRIRAQYDNIAKVTRNAEDARKRIEEELLEASDEWRDSWQDTDRIFEDVWIKSQILPELPDDEESVSDEEECDSTTEDVAAPQNSKEEDVGARTNKTGGAGVDMITSPEDDVQKAPGHNIKIDTVETSKQEGGLEKADHDHCSNTGGLKKGDKNDTAADGESPERTSNVKSNTSKKRDAPDEADVQEPRVTENRFKAAKSSTSSSPRKVISRKDEKLREALERRREALAQAEEKFHSTYEDYDGHFEHYKMKQVNRPNVDLRDEFGPLWIQKTSRLAQKLTKAEDNFEKVKEKAKKAGMRGVDTDEEDGSSDDGYEIEGEDETASVGSLQGKVIETWKKQVKEEAMPERTSDPPRHEPWGPTPGIDSYEREKVQNAGKDQINEPKDNPTLRNRTNGSSDRGYCHANEELMPEKINDAPRVRSDSLEVVSSSGLAVQNMQTEKQQGQNGHGSQTSSKRKRGYIVDPDEEAWGKRRKQIDRHANKWRDGER
ncbi:hypothetical protein BDV96DRAFT_657353 [Lophiotrema nucula]|uniref:Uncharacterized protein n=1 Tax=Lophiotrema nucula TaxID=690887 RepID=A0A6A5ZDF2_9PLEO|nr:hypothetical protein BDV96DRAFT_657353 [Lophiotrema nucula]